MHAGADGCILIETIKAESAFGDHLKIRKHTKSNLSGMYGRKMTLTSNFLPVDLFLVFLHTLPLSCLYQVENVAPSSFLLIRP